MRRVLGTALVVAAVVSAGAGCGTRREPVPAPTTAATASPAPAGCTFRPNQRPAARPAPVPPDGPPVASGTVAVTIETSAGPLPLTLNRGEGPCTVVSFVSLTTAGYFDNTPCHRITTTGIKVLQCGDPSGTGAGSPGYTIDDEPPANLRPAPYSDAVTYPRGTVAMANSGQPDSGSSQFFLVYGDSPLRPDYTVFGTVGAAGLVTLDRIAAAGDDGSNGPGDGRPTTPVTLTSVRVAG